jgi:hypothetical protein
MLPEEIFETRKRLVTTFPRKGEKNAKTILETYEFFIYARMCHIGKSFCKNKHTDGISMNCIQECVSIASSKISTFLYAELPLFTSNTVYVNWM